LSRLRDVLMPLPDSPIAGRPVASLSFALNYAAGGLDVRGYHIVNIALHLVCALLLLLVVRRTLEVSPFLASVGLNAPQIAFGAALLWALHPLNSEVVNYVSQRTESLMGACYLLTLYAAIRAIDTRRWEIVSVLACAAGVASKESIATAPLIIVLYDRVFLFESWRHAFAARRRLYIGLGATWILIAVVMATGPRAAVVGFASGVSPWTYLLNQALVIPEYLRLTVWPDSLVVFYGWPLPVTLADVLPSFALITALLVLTIFALWRWPAVGFLGAWFFVTLAPASSVIPVATEVGAERRMYLPLAAVAVLAVIAIDSIWRWLTRRLTQREGSTPPRAVAWTPLVIVAVASSALGAVTVVRNREYVSGVTLARTVVERRPTAVAHHILAEQLLLARQPDEAVGHLRQAVTQGNSRARYLLGIVLADQGKHEEAIQQLEAFVQTSQLPYRLVPRWLEPPVSEVVTARYTLGREFGLRGEWTRAAEQATLILDVAPFHVRGLGLLADAMFAQQQWSAAAQQYREYLNRQPADTHALINYGITQVAAENFDEAIAVFTRASEIDPADARARRLLALAQKDRASAAAQR
jgi:tetratricopeptide (TPR) repeat protein